MKKYTVSSLKYGTVTQILMDYSPANQAWLVWRRDDNHDDVPRIFNDKAEALREWERRVDFLQEVTTSS